jgi:hypothetical protein
LGATLTVNKGCGAASDAAGVDGHHDSPSLSDAGAAIERSVDSTLADHKQRTRDLGGSIGCAEFGVKLSSALRAE